MATTAVDSVSARGKGKERVIGPSETSGSESESDSDSGDISTTEGSDSEEEVTQEYLQSLLQRARANAAAAEQNNTNASESRNAEEVLTLDGVEQPPLPKLDPGLSNTLYLPLGGLQGEVGVLVHDSEIEGTERKSLSQVAVAPPSQPPELTKAGKPLTKKEKKDLKKQTAGPDWFDMPAPAEADLPRFYREVEALRLRNQLDPKRFYRRDEGEGMGIKGLPKYFALGRIVATEKPFGGSSTDNLPQNQRKRTLVDELLDDVEAKRYAKRKFNELQVVKGARGKNTLKAKQALRKQKW